MSTQISIPTKESQSIQKTKKKTSITAVQSEVKAVGRMHFIDNIRVYLTIMVVIFHLAITYGAVGSWFYLERPSTEIAEILLTLFVILNQFYFMGLFFLISGYFVPGSVDRKGSWRYFKDRLVRLGIPLIIFTMLVSPFNEWIKATHEGYFTGNLVQFYVYYWRGGDFAPGPLWFLEILLVFSMVYLLGRVVLNFLSFDRIKPGLAKSHYSLSHLHIFALIVILAPVNYIVRIFSPIGQEWNHIQLAFMPQYIFLFAAGILAFRLNWLPDLPVRVRRIWSVVAILSAVVLPVIIILGGDIEQFSGGTTVQSFILSSWEAIYCISMSVFMLSVFRSRLDFQGSFGKFLSKNAYTVYIIHAPLVIGLAYILQGITLDPLIKFVLISPLAVGLCFLTSHLVRHIPLADKVL